MIDGTRLRGLRKMAGLRVADLAKKTGLSESTLYKHEEKANYAAMSTVARLEKIFHDTMMSEASVSFSEKSDIKPVEFAKTGMQSLKLNTGPFDIVAKEKNYYEISLDANTRTMAKRAILFQAIRETFTNNYPFFITAGKRKKLGGVPMLEKGEINKIESEGELLNLVY